MSRAVPSARRIAGSLSAVAVAVGLAGCSAGQITQTSTQVTTVDGANGGVGPIELNDVTLSYPDDGEWAEGESPQLQFTVTSTSLQPDTLDSVSSDVADGATISVGAAVTQPDSTQPGSTPTAGASPTTAEESDAPGSGAGAGSSSLEIPAQGLVHVPSDEAEVTLDELTESLLPTQVVPVTFTFAAAGSVTIEVPVANSHEPQERGEEFDFHGEEH